MAIQAKENEIELIITWICNWTCEYCCVDTHNRPSLPFEDVKEKIVDQKEGSAIVTSEIGGSIVTTENMTNICDGSSHCCGYLVSNANRTPG